MASTSPPALPSRYDERTLRRLALTVACAVPLLLFGGAEAWLRLTSPHDDLWALTGRSVKQGNAADWAYIDAFSAYRGRPGVYHGDGATKTVNREGFISTPEIAVAKPAGTIRIAFFGESSTAGTGTLLSDSITWPWQAIEQLRRHPGRTAKLEFLNAALGGFTTFESFGRFWNRVRFFSPDIIVVYHGWNEMYYFGKVDEMPSWRTRPDGSWGLTASDPVTVYAPRWFDGLLRPSQLLTKARLRLTEPVNGEVGRAGQIGRPLEHDYDHRALELFRQNLRIFRAAAALTGVEMLVGKQATLIVPGLPESERARVNYGFHHLDHDGHVDAFGQLYRIIDEEIPADHVIDVTSLSGVPENFYDHIHPTPLGAERTATIMANTLEPYVQAAEKRLVEATPPRP